MKNSFLIAFLFLTSLGFAQNWSTNIEEAKAKAIEAKKPVAEEAPAATSGPGPPAFIPQLALSGSDCARHSAPVSGPHA